MSAANGLAPLAREGQEYQLNCTTQGGNPEPTISWFKNGEQLGQPAPGFIRIEQRNNGIATSSLLSFVPSADEHQAIYKCKVWNKAMGENTAYEREFVLQVECKFRLLSSPLKPFSFLTLRSHICRLSCWRSVRIRSRTVERRPRRGFASHAPLFVHLLLLLLRRLLLLVADECKRRRASWRALPFWPPLLSLVALRVRTRRGQLMMLWLWLWLWLLLLLLSPEPLREIRNGMVSFSICKLINENSGNSCSARVVAVAAAAAAAAPKQRRLGCCVSQSRLDR